MRRFVWLWLLVMAALGSGCGGDSPTRSNDLTQLSSIQIVSPLSGLVVNTSVQLQAIGNFSGLFTRDITDQVVWSSDDPGVATFDLLAGSVGRVHAQSAGTAHLTATVDGVPQAGFDLTVIAADLTAISVAPVDPDLPIGLTRAFTAAGHFDDGSALGIDQDITYDVTWLSSDPAIATIGNELLNKGVAVALSEGPTTISAEPDWSAVTGSSLLTVTPAALVSIALDPADGALLTLRERSFQATGTFTDGTSQLITDQVTWVSTNSSVATISAAGLVRGQVQGTTTIRASSGSVVASTPLLVTGGNLTAITLVPANPTLATSTSRRMTATGSFSNGTQRDITRSVTWSVTVPIATISNAGDDSGRLTTSTTTGTSPVRATFTPTSGATVSGETVLTVHAGILNGLNMSLPPAQDLIVGTSLPLKVTGIYSNALSQDLTEEVAWGSSNEAVALVEPSGAQAGLVRGLSPGSVSVTASLAPASDVSTALTVASASLAGLTIAPLDPGTSPGGRAQMTATADYGTAGTRDVTRDVTWSVDDSDRAVLAHPSLLPGLVYGVSAGDTVIRAEFSGMTASTILTVQ